jgi:predicted RNase H-like HicB family nuclease
VTLKIEVEQETDGRWIAEIPALPGVMAYGATEREAVDNVGALALRVVADKIQHGELSFEAIVPSGLRFERAA